MKSRDTRHIYCVNLLHSLADVAKKLSIEHFVLFYYSEQSKTILPFFFPCDHFFFLHKTEKPDSSYCASWTRVLSCKLFQTNLNKIVPFTIQPCCHHHFSRFALQQVDFCSFFDASENCLPVRLALI